jgi:predicted nucleotidyltransferase component of viral defense system
MIKPHCFKKEWIDGFRKEGRYKKINPPILEKMIQALYFLQNLQVNGLTFTFKGGTSLILLLNKANRFSIDIDIIIQSTQKEIEEVLDEIISTSHFKKWELDEKRSYKQGVPKAHYIIYFDSNLRQSSNYILLDILFEDADYPEIQETPIETKWIESDEVIKVQTPSIESITGDKLTAFAPNTTGIPYFKNEQSFSKEIIKQLFDLEKLFDEVSDIKVVSKSFQTFAKKEIDYRKLDITPEDVLRDTINTCLLIVQRRKNFNDQQSADFNELEAGIKGLGAFLISGNFRVDEAKLAAAKVAYLATKILFSDLSTLEKYNGQDVNNWDIEDKNWNFLNRLKRQRDKSIYYYWFKTVELLRAYS